MGFLGSLTRAPVSVYLGVTHFLGGRRRLFRRLSGACLVILGIHAAADWLDDALFVVIDLLDGWLDSAVAAVCGWFGWEEAATRFAAFFGPDEKEPAALVLAVLAEVVLFLAVIRFAWGSRRDDDEAEVRAETSKFADTDVERLAIVPVLVGFGLSGALVATLAVEGLASAWTAHLDVSTATGAMLAAGGAVVVFALLLWRLLPGLVRGGVQIARERSLRARIRRHSVEADAASIRSRWHRFRCHLGRFGRGWFLALAVLPAACVSVLAQAQILELVHRLGAPL